MSSPPGWLRPSRGKGKGEIEPVASALFRELGEAWMRRVIQLGEECSDRAVLPTLTVGVLGVLSLN